MPPDGAVIVSGLTRLRLLWCCIDVQPCGDQARDGGHVHGRVLHVLQVSARTSLTTQYILIRRAETRLLLLSHTTLQPTLVHVPHPLLLISPCVLSPVTPAIRCCSPRYNDPCTDAPVFCLPLVICRPVRHGRPGIGSTNSSRFIPLK